MDRRATLNLLMGRKREQTPPPFEFNNQNAGLSPYQGIWTAEQAAHLLRRTTFGPDRALIAQSVNMGLDATIDALFREAPLPDPPVNDYFENDPNVPVGQTWINAPNSTTVNLRGYRQRSLRAWTVGLLLDESMSIREKLTLFWHNHFAINNINEPRFLYRYISTLRQNAWGNFRELVKAVTIDPSMLRFLNGRQNSLQAPNENYARELLELFTIGKGAAAGPGDYTTFTEEDVREIARALTGWVDTGFAGRDTEVPVGAVFVSRRHDKGDKQLSHRFNAEIIPNMEDQEYAHVVDIIFKQEEVARFICRKMYRWFVFYQIDEATEANVIEPMANLLIEHNYEILPTLQALLKSEHFFDVALRGAMIKNPLDFTISVFKQLEFVFPQDLRRRYQAWFTIHQLSTLQQMEYFNPPDVAGWKAYYQEPLYYRTWINATTFPVRMDLTDAATTAGFRIRGYRLMFPGVDFINSLSNPSDPNELINELAHLHLPMPITESQIKALKEVLIPGLPDFEWTVEYLQYLEKPDDENLKNVIDTKVRLLFKTLFNMAEFNLI